MQLSGNIVDNYYTNTIIIEPGASVAMDEFSNLENPCSTWSIALYAIRFDRINVSYEATMVAGDYGHMNQRLFASNATITLVNPNGSAAAGADYQLISTKDNPIFGKYWRIRLACPAGASQAAEVRTIHIRRKK